MDNDTDTEAEPEQPYTIHCAVCDRKLMAVAYPVLYQPVLLSANKTDFRPGDSEVDLFGGYLICRGGRDGAPLLD